MHMGQAALQGVEPSKVSVVAATSVELLQLLRSDAVRVLGSAFLQLVAQNPVTTSKKVGAAWGICCNESGMHGQGICIHSKTTRPESGRCKSDCDGTLCAEGGIGVGFLLADALLTCHNSSCKDHPLHKRVEA